MRSDSVRVAECQTGLLPTAPWWSPSRIPDRMWRRGTSLPLDTVPQSLRLRLLQSPDTTQRSALLPLQNCVFKNAMATRELPWLLRAREYADLTLDFAPSDQAADLAYMLGMHIAYAARARAATTGSCADASLGLEGAAYALHWRRGPRPGHPALGLHGLVDSTLMQVKALCPPY